MTKEPNKLTIIKNEENNDGYLAFLDELEIKCIYKLSTKPHGENQALLSLEMVVGVDNPLFRIINADLNS